MTGRSAERTGFSPPTTMTADVENGNHFDVSCFDAVILKPVTFEKLKKLLQIKE